MENILGRTLLRQRRSFPLGGGLPPPTHPRNDPSATFESTTKIISMRALVLALLVVLLPCASANEGANCTRGTFYVSDSETCFACPDERWCRAGDRCRDGHTGYACSVCEDEWFYKDKSGVCKECPRSSDAIYAYTGTAIGVLLFCYVMYMTESGHDVTTFTIVATHFQLVYVFYEIPFEYPKPIHISMGPVGV